MTRSPGTSSCRATRPRHDVPQSVASARTRGAQLEVDAALVSGAVHHGLVRTRDALRRHDLAAALLVDPVNIRYVSGTSTMPVWTLHMIDRYMLVPAESEPILWEYASAPAELVSPDPHLEPVQLAIEQARATKGAAEIELIRRSLRVCDAAITHLHQTLRPGMTENEAWAVLTGRAFALGGEYVEARLLSSGPRTNPWFREAGDRRIEPGDLVSFDTDLIGPAGYLADVSRTYLAGDTKPTARQQRLYADAEAFLEEVIGELTPGAAFDEVGERLSSRLPRAYHPQRYPFIAHGSGLSDEYPAILFEDHHAGQIEAGMVFSVEAYVGVEGEAEGLKLEEQVLATEGGVEVLSHAPHDEHLSGVRPAPCAVDAPR